MAKSVSIRATRHILHRHCSGLHSVRFALDGVRDIDALRAGATHPDYLEWTEYLKVEDLRTRPFFTEVGV